MMATFHHARNEPLSHDHRNLITFLMHDTLKVHEVIDVIPLPYLPAKRSEKCLIEEISCHFTGLSSNQTEMLPQLHLICKKERLWLGTPYSKKSTLEV